MSCANIELQYLKVIRKIHIICGNVGHHFNLTHWARNKVATILQITFWTAFYLMEILVVLVEFDPMGSIHKMSPLVHIMVCYQTGGTNSDINLHGHTMSLGPNVMIDFSQQITYQCFLVTPETWAVNRLIIMIIKRKHELVLTYQYGQLLEFNHINLGAISEPDCREVME